MVQSRLASTLSQGFVALQYWWLQTLFAVQVYLCTIFKNTMPPAAEAYNASSAHLSGMSRRVLDKS